MILHLRLAHTGQLVPTTSAWNKSPVVFTGEDRLQGLRSYLVCFDYNISGDKSLRLVISIKTSFNAASQGDKISNPTARFLCKNG